MVANGSENLIFSDQMIIIKNTYCVKAGQIKLWLPGVAVNSNIQHGHMYP